MTIGEIKIAKSITTGLVNTSIDFLIMKNSLLPEKLKIKGIELAEYAIPIGL
jgi:hypothetical protein